MKQWWKWIVEDTLLYILTVICLLLLHALRFTMCVFLHANVTFRTEQIT